MLLAAAGVLDGRRATTNPDALDDLRARGTASRWSRRASSTTATCITAGAPACGLDLALHVLERIGGPALADAAARELRYERPAGGVLVPGLQPVGERA